MTKRALLLALTLAAPMLEAGVAPAEAVPPNLAHGRMIAESGTAGGAPGCASCHKLDGTGDETGAFPRLAGQGAFYLWKQLEDFRSGQRESETMAPIARNMSEAERQDVAGYYAAVRAPYLPPRFVDGETVQRGGMLSASGARDRNVPACANCHGPAGTGMPPSFPALAGQFARYIGDQLRAFRSGARRNDPLDVMRDIAARLDARDIDAVAAYFEQVRPAPGTVAGGG